MTHELRGTTSGGGPVLGIPAEYAAAWRGTLPPIGAAVPPGWTWGTPGGPECDYDRACNSIEDRVMTPFGGFGSVPVADGFALVFECELMTYWIPMPDGGVILRNASPASVDEARAMIAEVTDWTPWPRTLTLHDGRLFVFDAAIEGASDPAAIPAPNRVVTATPGPGDYAIWTATDEDENDYIKLVRK